MDDHILFRDPETDPSDTVVKQVIGEKRFSLYQTLKAVTENDLGITLSWRFYRDGNAWLCKAECKKKTVFWLSIWENYIKTTFYFTEKTSPGVFALEIPESLKETFRSTKTTGKLMPLTLHIDTKEQLADFITIAAYKKQLK